MDTPATRLTLLAMMQAEPADEGAWREFRKRYGPKIAEWCRKQKLPKADVEELTQNVIVQLFRARSFKYDSNRGRFRAYLFTVTKRAIAEWYRQKAKQANSRNGDLLYALPDEDDLLTRLEK